MANPPTGVTLRPPDHATCVVQQTAPDHFWGLPPAVAGAVITLFANLAFLIISYKLTRGGKYDDRRYDAELERFKGLVGIGLTKYLEIIRQIDTHFEALLREASLPLTDILKAKHRTFDELYALDSDFRDSTLRLARVYSAKLHAELETRWESYVDQTTEALASVTNVPQQHRIPRQTHSGNSDRFLGDVSAILSRYEPHRSDAPSTWQRITSWFRSKKTTR